MYTVMVILMMPTEMIAAQHICIGIVSIFHVIPIALSMAFSVFVGNMIGAQKVREAREYVKLSVVTCSIWGITSCTIMLIFK
jgi:Na+-driven multidrug efflux pump